MFSPNKIKQIKKFIEKSVYYMYKIHFDIEWLFNFQVSVSELYYIVSYVSWAFNVDSIVL